MNTNFSKKITYFNFVMTMLMVLYHWKNFSLWVKTPDGADLTVVNHLYILYDNLGHLSLGTFFMMSGFLLFYNCSGKEDIIRKMKKRTKTLLVPFFTWNFIYFVYEILYGLLKKTFSFDINEILLGFSFSCYDGPLWYLLALVILNMFAPAIFKLKHKKRLAYGVLALVSVLALVGCIFTENNVICSWFLRLLSYAPLWLFGSVCALNHGDDVVDETYRKKSVVAIMSVLAVGIVIYFVFFNHEIIYVNTVLKYIWVICTWGAIGAGTFAGLKANEFVKYNFFIYAMHSLVIGLINTVFNKLLGSIVYIPWTTVIIHFALIGLLYAICLGFALICKKILPKNIYYCMSGGRS